MDEESISTMVMANQWPIETYRSGTKAPGRASCYTRQDARHDCLYSAERGALPGNKNQSTNKRTTTSWGSNEKQTALRTSRCLLLEKDGCPFRTNERRHHQSTIRKCIHDSFRSARE
jgi:hypothetical protein